MKKLYIKLGILLSLLIIGTVISNIAYSMTCVDSHLNLLYPVVRISDGQGAGSGTIIYSKESVKGGFSTYVLTNHHVVASAIQIVEEWDSTLGKNVKREKRSLISAEIFKYKNLSTPIGTLRVEASVVLYNTNEDMALVKLSLEEEAKYVANLYPRDNLDDIHLFDKTIAVGCSLGWPPIPTEGWIARMNVQLDSMPYHMSTSQIVFGNSGGALYRLNYDESDGFLIGIPSGAPVVGWGSIITHMGIFIPIDRVYDWLEKEHYDFLWTDKTEAEGLDERKKAIEAKRKSK